MLDPDRLRFLAANRDWTREAVGLFESSGLSLREFADQSKMSIDRLTRSAVGRQQRLGARAWFARMLKP